MSDEFGRYRLEEKIGEGGLSEVHRARDAGGTPVALKRLSRAHLGSPELAAVFASEVAVASVMQSPRLLGAIDSGEVEGWPFLVMPLVDGGPLERELQGDQGLAHSRLPALANGLAEALTTMHGLGYVHADLSPDNVLFHDDARVVLGDFSACTRLAECQVRTQGTFSYMSPEQVRGQALNERSDVFSLATLLWQCTSGQRIFWREAQHLCFMAVVESDPPAMPPEFAAVEAVLRKALAKDAAARHASPAELCAAFVAAL